jgi:hypothetical protein
MSTIVGASRPPHASRFARRKNGPSATELTIPAAVEIRHCRSDNPGADLIVHWWSANPQPPPPS